MLQLTLQAAKATKNNETFSKADMFIDYQEGSIGFTVINIEKEQYDFSIEKEEWEQFKNFIETAMKQEIKTGQL